MILKALFFNYDLRRAVSEPRLHNQLSPNETMVEPGFNDVSATDSDDDKSARQNCVEGHLLNTVPLDPEHRGGFGHEEPPDEVSEVNGGRGAGGGSLRQRIPRSVGPPQVGLRCWILRSETRGHTT